VNGSGERGGGGGREREQNEKREEREEREREEEEEATHRFKFGPVAPLALVRLVDTRRLTASHQSCHSRRRDSVLPHDPRHRFGTHQLHRSRQCT
jgi:hypothetical protein